MVLASAKRDPIIWPKLAGLAAKSSASTTPKPNSNPSPMPSPSGNLRGYGSEPLPKQCICITMGTKASLPTALPHGRTLETRHDPYPCPLFGIHPHRSLSNHHPRPGPQGTGFKQKRQNLLYDSRRWQGLDFTARITGNRPSSREISRFFSPRYGQPSPTPPSTEF